MISRREKQCAHLAFVLVLIGYPVCSTIVGLPAFSQSHSVVVPKTNKKVMPGVEHLPKSKILLQHDDLVPTLNRQQAMQMEAETGHLPEYAEREMRAKGFLKDAHPAQQPVKKYTKPHIHQVPKVQVQHFPQHQTGSPKPSSPKPQ